MRAKSCCIVYALLIASILAGPAQGAEEKELIAVLDLQGVDARKAEVSAVTDRLREVLLKSGRFVLVDRSQIEAVLDEQALQQSGCTEQECAVQVGRILGVRKIIAGKVTRIEDRMWVLSGILVDVETAETIRAESIRHRGGYFSLLDVGVAELGAKLSRTDSEQEALAPVRTADDRALFGATQEPAPARQTTSDVNQREAEGSAPEVAGSPRSGGSDSGRNAVLQLELFQAMIGFVSIEGLVFVSDKLAVGGFYGSGTAVPLLSDDPNTEEQFSAYAPIVAYYLGGTSSGAFVKAAYMTQRGTITYASSVLLAAGFNYTGGSGLALDLGLALIPSARTTVVPLISVGVEF